jgi:hypothetical protein
MEEYLDENALARLPGRKYAQSEASEKISEVSGAPREEPEDVDGTGQEVQKHNRNKTNVLQALRTLACLTPAPHWVSNAPPRVSISDPTRSVLVAPGSATLMLLRSSRFHSLGAGTRHFFSARQCYCATSCLSSSPPVLPYYQELLCSLVSTCFNNHFWLCSLVLLSLTAEPPSGIKPQCVAVASLQTGGPESVQPSTCSPRSLHHALADPCPCTFTAHRWTSLPQAPLGVCGTVQKNTAVELHVKLCHCHLAAPTLLSGTVTVHSAGRR